MSTCTHGHALDTASTTKQPLTSQNAFQRSRSSNQPESLSIRQQKSMARWRCPTWNRHWEEEGIDVDASLRKMYVWMLSFRFSKSDININIIEHNKHTLMSHFDSSRKGVLPEVSFIMDLNTHISHDITNFRSRPDQRKLPSCKCYSAW